VYATPTWNLVEQREAFLAEPPAKPSH
jgi:hypothetical protein